MTQAEATLNMVNDLIQIFLVASVISLLSMPLIFVTSVRIGNNLKQTVATLITNTLMNYPFYLIVSIVWLSIRRF